MGVDHGGKGTRGTSPPELGVGGMLMQTALPPQILSHSYKKERSVAFKIRQNPFSAHDAPRPPIRLERGHPSPYATHSAPTDFRRSPCVPPQNSSQIYAYDEAVSLNDATKIIQHTHIFIVEKCKRKSHMTY